MDRRSAVVVIIPISPKHYVYRGSELPERRTVELIDSIYSTEGILQYTDAGIIQMSRYC